MAGGHGPEGTHGDARGHRHMPNTWFGKHFPCCSTRPDLAMGWDRVAGGHGVAGRAWRMRAATATRPAAGPSQSRGSPLASRSSMPPSAASRGSGAPRHPLVPSPLAVTAASCPWEVSLSLMTHKQEDLLLRGPPLHMERAFGAVRLVLTPAGCGAMVRARRGVATGKYQYTV